MDDVIQAALGLLAAVLTVLGGYGVQVLRAYVAKLAEEQVNLIQQRVGSGAARVAGEIAAEVMGNDQVLAATREMIEAGARELARRFPDTAGKLPPGTLQGMIVGELGKLGQAVTR